MEKGEYLGLKHHSYFAGLSDDALHELWTKMEDMQAASETKMISTTWICCSRNSTPSSSASSSQRPTSNWRRPATARLRKHY